MSTELVKVNPIEFGLDEKKAVEITSGLTQILEERKTLSKMYSEVINLEITKENLEKFRELRLKIRDNRTKGIEQWHKVNKEFYLRGGQFVDAIKKKEIAENERMESNLMENEKFFERQEAERFESEMKLRLERVNKFNSEITLNDVRQFNNENFEIFLSGIEKQYNDKIENEKKIEAERIERERIEKRHSERQLIFAPYHEVMPPCFNLDTTDEDFDKLLKEAKGLKEKRDKEIENQRLENEKIKKEAEKKEAQRLAELQIEKDKQAKLEAEINKQKEAEKLRLEQIEKAEKLAKKEAEKLAKAPIKKQLTIWVDSFNLPNKNIENELTKEIEEKFESFRKWAKTQIENI